MYTLKTAVIKGLWGGPDKRFHFSEDINIIIGKNGTGKTTIIRLIAATLEIDISTLSNTPFDSIEIVLHSNERRNRPTITVKKVAKPVHIDKDTSFVEDFLEFSLRMTSKATSIDCIVHCHHDSSYIRRRGTSNDHAIFEKAIKELVSVRLLTVHRTKGGNQRGTEEIIYPIDRKIRELGERFVKFFSLLDSKVKKEHEVFIENLILSLVRIHEREYYNKFFNEIDMIAERETLDSIFNTFNVDVRKYSASVNSFFSRTNESIKKWSAAKGITIVDISTLSSLFKMHEVVRKWKELQNKQEHILQHKSLFIEMVNKLFLKKVAVVTSSNELSFFTLDNIPLHISQLSSGEKQLLIMLGEAMLQEGSPYIFIADEPELSLHLEWQESLISNLLRLNPNVQILFATHSPDIIGPHNNDNHIFSIE